MLQDPPISRILYHGDQGLRTFFGSWHMSAWVRLKRYCFHFTFNLFSFQKSHDPNVWQRHVPVITPLLAAILVSWNEFLQLMLHTACFDHWVAPHTLSDLPVPTEYLPACSCESNISSLVSVLPSRLTPQSHAKKIISVLTILRCRLQYLMLLAPSKSRLDDPVIEGLDCHAEDCGFCSL